jgi:hypothetical protein
MAEIAADRLLPEDLPGIAERVAGAVKLAAG